MTISTYPIETALQAYSKQGRVRIRTDLSSGTMPRPGSIDTVSLTGKGELPSHAPDKISYTLHDILSGEKSSFQPEEQSAPTPSPKTLP